MRWGILSVGRISNDFVTALRILPQTDHKIIAVAARNWESAKEFSRKHNIPKFCKSYEELIKDPEVEVVYVGGINPFHFPLAKLAISNGKHVLCEKPLCMNVKETVELVELAREKGVFLMEGIWSRCFPAYSKLKEELNKGTVGEVLQVYASLGFPLSEVDNCKLKSLGGGSLLSVGIYCVQFATFVFGEEKPIKILAGGHLNTDGVDESISITLVYKGGRTATLISHNRVELMNDAFVIGTEGRINVPTMFVCPSTLITRDGEMLKFPLPLAPLGSEFNYLNSQGLSYEAQEIRECIKNGLRESPKLKLSESILIAEIMETCRKQLGVSYPQD